MSRVTIYCLYLLLSLFWTSSFFHVWLLLLLGLLLLSLLGTQIPHISLSSKLSQYLDCIHLEAFPLVTPKYLVLIYTIAVNSVNSIRPFFEMTFGVFSDFLSTPREWSSMNHSFHHSLIAYFSLNKQMMGDIESTGNLLVSFVEPQNDNNKVNK